MSDADLTVSEPQHLLSVPEPVGLDRVKYDGQTIGDYWWYLCTGPVGAL